MLGIPQQSHSTSVFVPHSVTFVLLLAWELKHLVVFAVDANFRMLPLALPLVAQPGNLLISFNRSGKRHEARPKFFHLAQLVVAGGNSTLDVT